MALALAGIASAGCDGRPDDRVRTLQQRVDELVQDNARLERESLDRQAKIADLQAQVETLQDLGPDRLNNLFVVDRIELASLTGGAEYDDVPGDDGVTVYLRPVDADGHVLKAAGEITIELLDANAPGAPKSLGLYVHNEKQQLRKLWHGGLLTNHYTIKCPWDPTIGPPTNREVTIKAIFYDFLTGKRCTSTKVVKVSLPD
ncbi:MAG TPA: cell division protein ZapB [Phycisphaerae bacterium]|nr:cell division protein ZapB [Phycisphaerae bacterium]